MARTAYFAPGVYVEEIPSARQPIAGVGTSTAAFIGLVDDVVFIPKPSPKYDPLKEVEPPPAGAAAAAATAAAATTTAEPAEGAAAQPPAAGRRGRTDAAAGRPEAEDLTYKSLTVRADLKNADSETRPYYLAPFTVAAKEYDTKLCTNFSEYVRWFGDFSGFSDTAENPNDPEADWRFAPIHRGHHLLTHAVAGFFLNGGTKCFVARIKNIAGLDRALEQFKSIDDVSIIAAPGLPKIDDVWKKLQGYCEDPNMQNVFAILDPPAVVSGPDSADLDTQLLAVGGSAFPQRSSYAAYYFPSIEVSDPAKALQDSDPTRRVSPRYRGRTYVPPSGHIAGIYARTDESRGVHKAPANAGVRGALDVKYYIGRAKQELLNPQGVNCIRMLNGEVTVWGARTVGGDSNGEFKYINVRRLMGFLEESLDQGTQWIVFEPNDPNLWSRIILNVSAFLTNVWRSGALFGLTPQEAFYVKCDAELNPPEVRDLGMVVTEIGVAIVRPAEFVIFRITQSTGGQPR